MWLKKIIIGTYIKILLGNKLLLKKSVLQSNSKYNFLLLYIGKSVNYF